MKVFAQSLVVAATSLLSLFGQPTSAAINHEPHAGLPAFKTTSEPTKLHSFSIQLEQQGTDKRICLLIENPGRKNLRVTLNGPDGTPVSNFFTGKKSVRMTRTYNFSIAEAGLYSLEVKYGGESIKKQIRLEYADARPADKLTIE